MFLSRAKKHCSTCESKEQSGFPALWEVQGPPPPPTRSRKRIKSIVCQTPLQKRGLCILFSLQQLLGRQGGTELFPWTPSSAG
ncbi:hypothetical protein ACRRTK_024916 [Alexandromys fortis]